MFCESKFLRSWTLITLAFLVTANGTVEAEERLHVEVFTSSDLPTETDSFKSDERVSTVDVYAVDGIERIEAGLSRGLPNDPDAANLIALPRIGQMDAVQTSRHPPVLVPLDDRRYRFDINLTSRVAMPNVTLRDVPADLHYWLKQRAAFHHRSVNKEVIALLEAVRGGTGPAARRASAAEIMDIARRASELPLRDRRSEEEILGYGNDGLPG